MKHFFALIFAIYASFHLMVFNKYMHYSTVRAEIIENEMAYDANGRVKIQITYKREDGLIFRLPASIAEWQAATPGEKRWVKARPLDMEPSSSGILIYVVTPLIVALLTAMYLIWFLMFFSWSTPKAQRHVSPPPKDSLEE